MDGQINTTAEAATATIFNDNQTKPFSVLAQILRERLAISTRDLSLKLGKRRDFIKNVEDGKILVCEKDVKPFAEALGLNNGLESRFTQKWRENYETGMDKVFAEYQTVSFPKFFHAIRSTTGISPNRLASLLGKSITFIYHFEDEITHSEFPEKFLPKITEIFCFQARLAEEFKARRDKHYANWQKCPRAGKNNSLQPAPKLETGSQPQEVDQEKLEDAFLENDIFPDLLHAIRIILKISAEDLTAALGQAQGFIERVEDSMEKMDQKTLCKLMKIFNLNDRFTSQFIALWTEGNEGRKQVETDESRQTDTSAKPLINQPMCQKKTTGFENIANSPLGRLFHLYCLKAGFATGLQHLQRNNGGEFNLFDLAPGADRNKRLATIACLSRLLKLDTAQIHELSTILFAFHPGMYSVTVKGGGMDFFDHAIPLISRSMIIAIEEIKDIKAK